MTWPPYPGGTRPRAASPGNTSPRPRSAILAVPVVPLRTLPRPSGERASGTDPRRFGCTHCGGVNSNFNGLGPDVSDYFGMSEVRFIGTAVVPEPTAIAIGAVLSGAYLLARRCRGDA